ncbi:hypothetical protein THAOC_00773, partial [Thalassiosira oceanica]
MAPWHDGQASGASKICRYLTCDVAPTGPPTRLRHMQLCRFPVRGVNRRPVQDPGDLARHHGDAAGDPGARGQEL